MKILKSSLTALLALALCLGFAACGGAQDPSVANTAGYWEVDGLGYVMHLDGKGGWVEYDPVGDLAFEGTVAMNSDGNLVLTEVDLGEYGTAKFNKNLDAFSLERTGSGTVYDYNKTDETAIGKGA